VHQKKFIKCIYSGDFLKFKKQLKLI